MAGDYSRKTFNRKKHYSGVLMQQGRVQLDSDWNEQLAIQLYRTETEAIDVVGQSGVPKKNDGFKIGKTADGHDLTIAAGRIYVDGQLCELDQPTTYTGQPYLPNPEFTALATSPPSSPLSGPLQLSLTDGTYLVYLDAWKREITALDDRLIREVALGGPDTATRIQNVFQIKLLPFPPQSPPGDVTCETPLAQFDQLDPLSTGTLNARTQPPPDQENPCLLPPSAGYTRLENQLYRVEVQTSGARNQATFKWSRDNASVETRITNIDGSKVTVESLGKDDVLGFAGDQWVEIADEESTLKGSPHALVQISSIDPSSRKITMKTSVAALSNLTGLKLRRWDQSGVSATTQGVSAALANWIDLEGGIQVQLSAGHYNAGDYWLIPARTTTGEIEWPPFQVPNTNPAHQPARGIRHHYCRLALISVKGGLVEVKEDCRKRFPALTDICAEDVCFDDTNCQLGGADTVQEALDRLCAERDLRFHNKHLHGWGIVCGLQVECGPDPLGQTRRHVTVRKGYAIDCEGNDVILQKDEQIDLLDLIHQTLTFPPASPLSSPPGGIPDTDVCLVLDSTPGSKTRYRVESYPKQKRDIRSLLKGTLLMDFLTECVQSLFDFVREQFTSQPGEEKEQVGPTQKRITTFSNLLIGLTNTQNSAFVFLSGEKGQSGKNLEDTILRDFYTKLREKLQSHTFCAMFENARQFPDYPYSGLDIATIFSKGFQTRVRVSPNSSLGYSIGSGNKINVFDLKTNEMIDQLEFPGSTNSIVQDVAFSKNGNQLFAVATVDDKDSMFVVADISGTTHTFRKPVMVCDVLLVTLGTSPSTSENVFAIGKTKGLYTINPQNVDGKAPPTYSFNATGQLAIDDVGKTAFAAASGQAAKTDTYDRVLRLALGQVDPNPPVFQLAALNQQLTGSDDIALSFGQQRKLYVVVNPPTSLTDKHVLAFVADSPKPPVAVTNLKQNTAIRLAYNPITDHMMVTYEDTYRVGMLDPKDTLVPDFVPVQISPLSIAVAPNQNRTYVLNYASNTISSIPSDRFAAGKQIPLKPLVDYRADVLNAFADLLAGLLQYLKDCFCDHLLVDCPECGPDDKIYLACISIKNGQVFKVCNFSLRKYVHSFPTVEYWLSLIPIVPMIQRAVESFCCSALPGLFGRFNAPRPAPPANTAGAATNTLQSSQIRRGVTFAQQADFRAATRDLRSRATTGRPVLTDLASNIANRLLVRQPNTVTHTEVAGQSTADATKQLQAAGVIVDQVETYDPARGTRNLVELTGAPARLEAGSRVKLVTKDNKVLFFARADDPPPAVEGFREEVAATRKAVDDTNLVVAANRADVEKIVPQLQDLSARVDLTKASVDQTTPQLQDLRAQINRANETIDRTAPQVEDLRAKLAANTTEISTNTASIADALRMRDDLASLRSQLVQVQQTHAQELASRDAQIAELRASTVEFRTTTQRVAELQTRIEKLSPGTLVTPGTPRLAPKTIKTTKTTKKKKPE